jgi:non-ribosomal peptide synthetase component F/alpha-ketoglutarate-dependent taurine dioxygenase/acyl carrier protein
MKESVEEFLSQMGDLGVKLWLDGDRLRCHAPAGTITSTLRSQLAARKAEIQTFLGGQSEVEEPLLPTIIPNPDERYEPFPLTDVQYAYWIGRSEIFELSNVATHSYTEIDCIDLDLSRLNLALQKLIDRHEMLRAIVQPDGQQRILERVPPYEIQVLDLRHRPPEIVDAKLAEIRSKLSHEVLPADKYPLFNLQATKLSDTVTRLHVSFDALLSDAWSNTNIINRELILLMDDLETPLPPIKVSFRDYVLAEIAFRNSQTYQHSLQYWQSRLATLPPAPELPLEKNLAAIAQPRFVHLTGRLEADRWQQMKQKATKAGLTPSGLLLAVLAEIIALWSKNPRFTLNLTLFNRLPVHPDIDRVVGDFTSITLLAVDNSGRDSFIDRARRIQQQLWEDLDRRYVSGIQVLRELARLQKQQTRAIAPVVFTSTLTNDLEASETEFTSSSLMGDDVYTNVQTPQVYLDNGVGEERGALLFNWNAVPEIFSPGVLDDMFATYCHFLERLADEDELWQSPNRQLLPAAQIQQIAAINQTETELPSSGLLHGLFFDRAALQPEKVAVVSGEVTLTYQELSDRALTLADRLQQLGVRPNQLVAIVMEKGWEQVVAALGILASGAAYVPIDPQLPTQRRHHLLAKAEVKLVVTQPWLQDSLEWPEHITCLTPSLPHSLTPSLPHSLTPSSLAYVIYTSGSTGMPKGVAIAHEGAVNTIMDVNQRFQVNSGDRAIALSALSFDLSVYDIFGLLAAGGTIVIPEDTRDPAHWLELLERHQITIWNSVPALMQMLVEYAATSPDLKSGSIDPESQPSPKLGRGDGGEGKPGFANPILSRSLRLVLLSGDWLPLTLSDGIRGLFSNPQIISLGGATEASIWSIIYPIEQIDPNWKSIPYGRPMANQRFYVLNEALENCPIWVTGHLYIGGVGLAQFYWRDPDKTNASFIIHPQTQERLYKTGDLGRYLPDGNIEFLGREDFQVKINGYRIELGEIETALQQHPDVKEAIVTAVGESRENQQLVAYIVPVQDVRGAMLCAPTEGKNRSQLLSAYLQEKLPRYMVPSAYIFLEAFPLTANGKVDRKALPTPILGQNESEVTIIAPRTPIQEVLVGIWLHLLEVERVGIEDNFFDLGGNSLLATQVVSRARSLFKVEIPLRWLFESPTVAELSDRIANLISATSESATLPIKRAIDRSNLPLSFAQQRLWFLDQLQPNNTAYNMSIALRLVGNLNLAALDLSLNELIRRHEVLRTNFAVIDGETVQVIAPINSAVKTATTQSKSACADLKTKGLMELDFQLSAIDLQMLPKEEREAKALDLANAEANLPFNLAQDRLIRGQLLKLGANEHIILLTMHHIVYDAWSEGVLIREISALYEAFSAGKPSPLPELTIQYADFASWQRQWLQGEVLERLLSYWQKQLAGVTGEIDFKSWQVVQRCNEVEEEESTSFLLNPDLAAKLQQLSRQEGVTVFMTLLALLQTLLYRYSDREDIVVGTDIANRDRAELEPLIGFFINLLVMRTNFAGNPSFRELLARVREVALGAYTHQDLPFAKLVEAIQPDRNSKHTPVFQVLFVFQNTPNSTLNLSDLSVSNFNEANKIGKFDLVLFATETPEGIEGNWQYNPEIFNPSAIARMSRHFETLAEDAIANFDTRINSLKIMTQAEKIQQTLAEEQSAKSKFQKFKSIKPKAVNLPQGELVKTGYLEVGETLPLVIQPNLTEFDVANWAKNNRSFIETELYKHGGILFRGFDLKSVADFENFAQAICPQLFGEYGDLPREGVSRKVYGSTPYPSDRAILFHNESSHLNRYPLKIWFFCVQPATKGGETPIVDCRRVYQLLNPKLQEVFAQKQLMYVRNYIEGLDVSWQDFFHTNDKTVVEDRCRQAGIEWEWIAENHLRTRTIRPAIIPHPQTGETSFFNQLQLHHISCLEPSVRSSLLSVFTPENLPRHVYYGDGSPIEDSVIEEIVAAYHQATRSFTWQQGDILMLDNILAAHSRNPYEGSRKIVVAMGEIISITPGD